jgi:hypothetical protein
VFRDTPNVLAIILIGNSSARCNLRISAQSSTDNTSSHSPRPGIRGETVARGVKIRPTLRGQYSAVVDTYQQFIYPLKEKITAQYEIDSHQLQELRRHEADLYSFSKPGLEQIDEYQQLRQQLSAHGEMPDSFGATSFMVSAAYQMTSEIKLPISWINWR